VRAGFLSRARTALVGAVIAGYVLALALATSPQLHDLCHHDARQREHVCLATILHSGGSEPVAVAVVAVAALPALIAKVPLPSVQDTESFFLRCRLLRHGPPAFLLS